MESTCTRRERRSGASVQASWSKQLAIRLRIARRHSFVSTRAYSARPSIEHSGIEPQPGCAQGPQVDPRTITSASRTRMPEARVLPCSSCRDAILHCARSAFEHPDSQDACLCDNQLAAPSSNIIIRIKSGDRLNEPVVLGWPV